MTLAITGASGFLGRELLRRIDDEHIVAISRSEKGQLALRAQYPNVEFRLGDVCDLEFLRRALDRCSAVIHAAALKHVNISEQEPTEYSRVNVTGSLNVASVASTLGIRAVGVSTDKACCPHNAYGLTKALMERAFCEQGHVCVRYGNVFGSDGSVLHAWERQAAEGVIRVTDPEMTRFYFTGPAAVDAVLWALGKGSHGTVTVPRLRALTIGDLAEAFAEGHPSRPRVEVVGPRPGEKRHEMLLSPDEAARAADRGPVVEMVPHGKVGFGVPPILSETAKRIPAEEIAEWVDEWLALRRAA